MALSIKNDEAERLARELATATGESVTRAVSVAVRERLERVNSYQGSARAVRAARLWQIADDSAGRWVAPFGTADHGDLLYDEAGLPR